MAIWLRESACSDGRKSALESDVDCGGTCGGCAIDKSCSTGDDCASGVCTDAGKCGGFEVSCYGIQVKNDARPE